MGDRKRHIYRGPVVDLWSEDATLPNGRTVPLDIIHHPGAAAIVALDEAGQVLLLRQYRHAVGGYIWEIPAGKLDPGEQPSDCARRELEEETGQVAAEWSYLGSIVTTPGFCDERIHLFLASSLTATAQNLGQDEVLTVTRRPLSEAMRMIRVGEIQDAKSIAGLHLAAAWLAEAANAAESGVGKDEAAGS